MTYTDHVNLAEQYQIVGNIPGAIKAYKNALKCKYDGCKIRIKWVKENIIELKNEEKRKKT